jgi:hypothetical protein
MPVDDDPKQAGGSSMSSFYRLLRRAGLAEKTAAWFTILVLAATAGFYIYRTFHSKESRTSEEHSVELGAQSGTGNSQQVIGTSTQNGGLGCTQNVGIGSNNVLNCKPELPTMSPSQVQQVSALLADAPRIPGQVIVKYEATSAENGQLAHQLYQALVNAHINSTIEGCRKTFGNTIDYPGLSIMYVKKGNVDLANTIESALITAKVITQQLEPSERNMDYPGNDLTFVIRNP